MVDAKSDALREVMQKTNSTGGIKKEDDKPKRYVITFPNMSLVVIKRVLVALEKDLEQDKYVIKNAENSIIVSSEYLDLTKKIIYSVDDKINISINELKEKYRYVFYLENLDCANCAAKIERISKRNIVHESIVCDFATLKIVIDTTKNYDPYELRMKVQENAEMVDPRIEVKEKLRNEQSFTSESFKIPRRKKIEFIIGISIFLIFFLIKTIAKFVLHDESPLLTAFIYIGYTPAYFLLAKDILWGALNNLKNGRVFDEKFLMSLATIMALCCGLYDEALFVIIFYQIGEMCQEYAVNYSRKSVAGLVNIKAQVATIEVDGEKKEIDPNNVMIGDIICVNTGDNIPLDGVVISGHASIDTQALTGESKSVEVDVNDEILSGAIVIEGSLRIKVTNSYENSMVSKILNLVDNASTLKSKSETFISKFSRYYTPAVVTLAVIIAIVLPFTGMWHYHMSWEGGWKDSIRVAMIFMVISCPCALVISIPLGFFGGIGAASKKGILVKGSNYLESLSKLGVIVFDKTGTLTKGNFAVTKVVSYGEYTQNDIMHFAAYAESTSNHVIARSIIASYDKPIDSSVVEMKIMEDKRGIVALVEGKEVALGRKAFMEQNKIKTPLNAPEEALFVALEKELLGYIIIEDEIRNETKNVIDELKKKGIKVVMITGDSKKIAENTANILGIEEFYYEMSPIDKVDVLTKLKDRYPNKTIGFVGDGINDAPVISSADVGIAMGGFGNDATMQIADIVLLNQDLNKVINALNIANVTRKIVIQNIVFALFVKLVFLIIAPINLSQVFNIFLVPGAIFADVGVSLIAILNSLRAIKAGDEK